jgi:hypothetical protein
VEATVNSPVTHAIKEKSSFRFPTNVDGIFKSSTVGFIGYNLAELILAITTYYFHTLDLSLYLCCFIE